LAKSQLLEQFGDLALDPLEVGADPGVGHGVGAGAALEDAADPEQTDGQLGHEREHHWTARVALKTTLTYTQKRKKRTTDQTKTKGAGGGAEARRGVRVRDVGGGRLGGTRRLAQLHQVHVVEHRSNRSRCTKHRT
jgi:hypothetical protein